MAILFSFFFCIFHLWNSIARSSLIFFSAGNVEVNRCEHFKRNRFYLQNQSIRYTEEWKKTKQKIKWSQNTSSSKWNMQMQSLGIDVFAQLPVWSSLFHSLHLSFSHSCSFSLYLSIAVYRSVSFFWPNWMYDRLINGELFEITRFQDEIVKQTMIECNMHTAHFTVFTWHIQISIRR